MTPDDIARMVADADGVPRFKPARLYAGYVRALAAELTIFKSALHDESRESDQWQLKCNALAAHAANETERVRVQTSALRHHIKKWTEIRDKNFALEAQLEAITMERDRYKAALERIVEGRGCVIDADYADIAREALKGV